MKLERYELAMEGQLLVFLDIVDSDRLARVREALAEAGGSCSTPRTLVFAASKGVDLRRIMDLVSELGDQECVAVVTEHSGTVRSFFVVPPSRAGGIVVRDA